MSIPDLTYLQKKIIYRSQKRGCRESEIILEKFIKKMLQNTNYNILLNIDLLLSYDDNKILDWLQSKTPPPFKLKNLVNKIKQSLYNE